jgi:glucosamine 6-phosphate synthetase-like amidotransferase/phosphosugar isomerase protein
MCGISGVSRNATTSIPHGGKFAVTLAHAIEDRGRDSTGFGWGQSDDEDHVYYAKMAGRASKVADLLPLPGKGIHSLIAHTRHGTKGSPKINDNNHPVVAENIVCVHNGRVDNDDELIDLADMKGERLGTVDSWAIPALLSKQIELGASVTDLLELVEGVAAIAWLNSHEPGVLHLARLSTRPLTLGWTKRGDLVFASTTANLRKAANLGKVGIEDITTLKEGTYLRIVQGGIEAWEEFKPRHPKIEYAIDMPGVSAPKPPTNVYPPTKAPAKGKKKGKGKRDPHVMSHNEWMQYRERLIASAAEQSYLDSLDRAQAKADAAYLDTLPDNAWEHEVSWDDIVPRRGHKGYNA